MLARACHLPFPQNQNMNRMKIVRRDRDEWKDAHERQVNEVAAKTASLLKAETDLRDSGRKLAEQEKLVTQLAARITALELGCKDACDDVTISIPSAQQHTPPASPDREGDAAEEVVTKKPSKGKFQLPAILVRRSANDLNDKGKGAAAPATPKPAASHGRDGSDSSMSTAQRDSIVSVISQKKRLTPTRSRAGSRSSSTTTLQRDSVASSLANQTLFSNLSALSLPRDMRTT